MTTGKALFKGGVRPPGNMQLSLSRPIANAAVPALAVIPMLQHAGTPAECIVRPGELVREGMLIGKAAGAASANVHASIPGRVVDIVDLQAPPGIRSRAVRIELGGEFDKSGRSQGMREWESLSPADLLERVRSAGVVELGGSNEPAPLRLAVGPGRRIGLLVANGVGCEPSLTADRSLMREKPREIAEGMRICRQLLDARRVVLAFGDDAEELVPEFERIFSGLSARFEVAVLPCVYPQAHAQLLVESLRGTSPGADSVVLDVATLYAVYEAVVLDKPLIERIVTITGSVVTRSRDLKVRIGTPVADLFEECGGLSAAPGKVVLGGPMRGVASDSLDVPVTKGVGGIVAFSIAEARALRELPCIRCGKCAEACPWGLVPTRLYKLVDSG